MNDTDKDLRILASAMIMDSYDVSFQAIFDKVLIIVRSISNTLDDLKIEHDITSIHSAVIDSICLGLKLKCELQGE